MNKDTLRQWANMVAAIVTIVMNVLANALPFNGQNTGTISDQFKVYFVPAGYVFSIWGLIYVGIIAFAIYQALPSQRENQLLRKIGYLFVLSCIANIAWLFLWHYNFFVWTLVAMIALLICLIGIYLTLGIGRTSATTAETWSVKIPFSVYLGWITVATIANVTDVLYYINWSGWGLSPETWMIIILIVAVAVAALVSFTRGDIAYMLVIIWAFAGIAIKHSSNKMIANTTWIMTGVVALLLILGVWMHSRNINKTTS
jgi:benzodiazapine receptor